MAKRSNKAFNQAMASIPAEANFVITCAAASTTEVWTDIDTNLDTGEAWVIYGLEWQPALIDPTVPLAPTTTLASWTLQIHRNDDNEILVSFDDDDLLFTDTLSHAIAGAAGISNYAFPRKIVKRTITMQPTLRAIFRTSADDAIVNGTDTEIVGKIFYDKIAAPDVGVSKLGLFAQL